MSRLFRWCAVAVVVAGSVGAGASAAVAAAPSDGAGCTVQDPSSDGYADATPCQVAVVLDPVCDVSPSLEYAATVTGGSATTVDVTFVTAAGDVTYSGQPLSGSVAWPATAAATSTVVLTTAGRSVTATATLPDEGCGTVPAAWPVDDATTTSTTTSTVTAARPSVLSAALASTGAEVAPVALGAGALLLVGAGAVVVSRRRRA